MNISTSRAGTDQLFIGPFVNGLVTAVAFGGVASSAGSTDSGVLMVAIAMGVAAAVFALSRAFLRRPSDLLYDGMAVLLFIPAVAAFVNGSCDSGVATPLRWTALVLLMAVAGVTAAASLLTLHKPFRWGVAVAMLGAVETMATVTTFLAGSGSSSEMMALAIMVPSVFILGWFVIRFPAVVTGVAAVALGMQAIYGASTDVMCGGNASGLVVILLYCGAYFATRAVAAPFSGRRKL
jgi:hypothetical protein